MYANHYSLNFTNSRTDLVTGFLGAVLAQPGKGGKQINEAHYYYAPKGYTAGDRYSLKPRSYNNEVFIKAVAVSCGGCKNVQKYATFTCEIPQANG